MAGQPPECVQKLAQEFPLGSSFSIRGQVYYLVGYTEQDQLLLSLTDPAKDYTTAVENQEFICAQHVREAIGRGQGQ